MTESAPPPSNWDESAAAAVPAAAGAAAPVTEGPAQAPVKTPIDKRARRALMTIFLIVLTDLIGFGMIIPLIPFYAESMNASEREVGMLFGIFSLFQFIFTPIWGRLSDRIGRKPVLVVSLLVSVGMYWLYGWASTLPILFFARAGAGLGTANIGTAQAYIADILPADRRAVGMGVLGAGFGLGFIFGPALGGILTSKYSVHMPGYAAAGLSALALLMTLAFLHEAPDRKPVRGGLNPFQIFKKYWNHPAVRSGWWIIGLDIFAFSVMEVTLSLWLIDVMPPLPFSQWPVFNWLVKDETALAGFTHGKALQPDTALTIGLGMALVGVVMAVIQGGMIRRLAPKYGERRMLQFGLFSFACGLILLPFLGRSYWLILIPVLMQVVGQSLIQPSNFALISRNADPAEQGAVMGIGQSISSLMRALGPVAATLLVAEYRPQFDAAHKYLAYGVPYWIAGILVLVALAPMRRMTVPEGAAAAAVAMH